MASSIRRIGIIQNAPLPGDFSNNLRALVQGYRDCIDHGAELVIAPADALCGLDPQDLAERPSFEEQTQRALDALSAELGAAPLILGAYMRFIADDELWDGMLGEDDGMAAAILRSAGVDFSQAREQLLNQLRANSDNLHQAPRMPVFGGGKSPELASAANAYREFLLAFAKGETDEKGLLALLDTADEQLNVAFEKSR